MAIFFDQIRAEGASQAVADGYPGRASGECGGNCRREFESPFENEESGEGEQPLVRYRSAHDTEDQKKENPGVTVLPNPVESELLHRYSV